MNIRSSMMYNMFVYALHNVEITKTKKNIKLRIMRACYHILETTEMKNETTNNHYINNKYFIN